MEIASNSKFKIIAVIITIIMFVMLGVFFWQASRISSAVSVEQNLISHIQDLKLVITDLDELQAAAKLLAFDGSEEHIFALTDALSTVASDNLVPDIQSEGQSLLGAMSPEVGVLVALVREAGLTENLGLRGALRTAAHKIEAMLVAPEAPRQQANSLLVTLLMMRRHEKDYMLRGSTNALLSFDEAALSFVETLNSMALMQGQSDELLRQITDYKSYFDSYTDASNLVAVKLAVFLGLENEFDLLVETKLDSLKLERDVATNSILDRRTELTFIVVSIVLAAALVTLALLRSLQISRWIELKLNHQKRALDEHALVAITDRTGAISYVNDKLCELSQYNRMELLGRDHKIFNSGYHPAAFFENMYSTINSGKTWRGEVRNKRKDGSFYWLDATIVPLMNQVGGITQFIAIRTDISAQKNTEFELKETYRYLQSSIDSMLQGFAIWDAEDRLILANEAYRQFHAPISGEIVPGIKFLEMLSLGFDARIWKTRDKKETWLQNQVNNLRTKPLYSEELALRDGRTLVRDGKVLPSGEVVLSISDISSQREREAQLMRAKEKVEHIAYYDLLTGLGNRANCSRELGKRFMRDLEKHPFSIIQIDLDKFKRVNDTLGHAAGDLLLVALGDRFTEIAQNFPDFACYRWGGDEFIAIVGSNDRSELREICKELSRIASIPLKYNESTLHPTVSLGIASCPNDATNMENLMIFSDLALYKTKELGRDGFHFFTKEMKKSIDREAALEREMRIGLDQKQFELFYQPKIDVKTGTIIGMEALVRWNHPEHGLLAPGRFMPVAESSSLAPRLGSVIFEQAMAASRGWLDQNLEFGRMAVNLSPQHLSRGTMLDDLFYAMTKYDIGPDKVTVELLESYILDDPNSNIHNVLTKLVDMGIYVDLDDFGTGYASLSHLAHLPITGLKIDKDFVSQVDQGSRKQAIVSALISMARLMRLNVTCEGVETHEQLLAVNKIGKCSVQGYFIARPMRYDAATEWIKSADGRSIVAPDSRAVG